MQFVTYFLLIIGLLLYFIYRFLRKAFRSIWGKQKNNAAVSISQTGKAEAHLPSSDKDTVPDARTSPDFAAHIDLDSAAVSDQDERHPDQTTVLRAPPPLSPDVFFKKHLSAYVAFDLETTGLDPQSDRIVEIGAVKVLDGKEADSFQTLVHPGVPIPAQASAVHHITDEMVADAPAYAEAVHAFVEFIGDLPCVAHNAAFDVKFLYAAFSELEIPKLIYFSDSLKMARQSFPGLPNKKLGTVCDAIGYQIGQAHCALDDAKAVHAIVQACAVRAEEMEAGKRALDRHNKVTIAINQAYAAARQSEDTRQDMMDAVLSLCREDFALVQTVREHCARCGYPAPVFDSFRRAAIILAQRKDLDAAIQVCDQAIALDIPDSTVEGGMEGRRDKLLAQRDRQAEKQAADAERARKQEEREAKKQEAEKNKPGIIKRAVRQFQLDGVTLIREFESVSEASQQTGVNVKCIRDAAGGKQKTAGGFVWKYAESSQE